MSPIKIKAKGGMMQNNDENRNVGENIRLYLIRAGLTVKELSKRIHQHHQLVIKPGSHPQL